VSLKRRGRDRPHGVRVAGPGPVPDEADNIGAVSEVRWFSGRRRVWVFAVMLLVVPVAVVVVAARPWEALGLGCDPNDRDRWAIAYELPVADESSTRVLQVESGDETYTVKEAREAAYAPELSPDGTQLLRTARITPDGGLPYTQVVVSRLDGSGGHELIPGGGPTWGKWSPDGERIAFVDYDTELVMVAPADGDGEAEAVGQGLARADIEWSPDGRRLAWGFEHTIVWADLDSVGITEVVYADPGDPPSNPEFSWLPEGDGFVVQLDRNPHWNVDEPAVARFDLEGHYQEVVLEDRANDLFLLPDGALGAVVADAGGDTSELIAVDLASGDLETVVEGIGSSASVAACGERVN
jgi:hypothetical protein